MCSSHISGNHASGDFSASRANNELDKRVRTKQGVLLTMHILAAYRALDNQLRYIVLRNPLCRSQCL